MLELKFVRLEILSTSFIDFLYEELGELRSSGPERVKFKEDACFSLAHNYPDLGAGISPETIGLYQLFSTGLKMKRSLLQPSGSGSGLGKTPPNTNSSPWNRLQL